MTRLPVRCLVCGSLCRPGPHANGRCDRCDRARHRIRNAFRRHYGGDWPAIRRAVIADRPWCDECHAGQDLTVDHIVPVARGGTNERGNLRVLCRPCNSSKGAR